MKSGAERADSGPDVADPAAARRHKPQPSTVRKSAALMNPRAMAMLQRSAGNAAVAGIVGGRGASASSGAVALGGGSSQAVESEAELVTPTADLDVQRAATPGSSFAPPVPPSAPNPKADPKFTAVSGTAKSAGQQLKKHALNI